MREDTNITHIHKQTNKNKNERKQHAQNKQTNKTQEKQTQQTNKKTLNKRRLINQHI